jgi:hypothetical protein
LETGKIIVPVDSELFSVGFQSLADVLPNGDFWVHERCVKWSLGDGDKINDHDLIRTTVINTANQVYHIEVRFGIVNDNLFRNVQYVIVLALHSLVKMIRVHSNFIYHVLNHRDVSFLILNRHFFVHNIWIQLFRFVRFLFFSFFANIYFFI